MTIVTKQVVEFGRTVTLYRAVDSNPRCSTLWHGGAEKALAHWMRKRARFS